MNMIKRLLIISIVCHFMSSTSTYAMNLLQPSETLLRPPYDRHLTYHTNVFIEGGFGFKNFNACGPVASPLHVWQPEQNALAMLKGFCADSAINALSNQLDANDDGIRGHFNVCGDVEMRFAAAFNTRFFFLNNWFVSTHLPMYHLALRNVRFTDKTENKVDADYRVKTLLTDALTSHVQTLGNLSLTDWTRTGVGDLSILLNWYRDFPQMKEVLKNARINWRVGVTTPLGKKTNLDLLYAQPFGNDGAWSLPFGLGLDLMFGRFLQAGLDVQLTPTFGHVSNHRIKTDRDQTELLLLQTARAYRDYGLTQRFNLYVQMNKFLRGFSFLLGYQFMKHGRDHLTLCSNAFSNVIANSAESLQEWTAHHMIINSSYDFAVHTWNRTRLQPYVSLYARIPFNGKRFAGSRTLGCVLAIDF